MFRMVSLKPERYLYCEDTKRDRSSAADKKWSDFFRFNHPFEVGYLLHLRFSLKLIYLVREG